MVNKPRIWEIDFFRCLAILLMIIYHLVYDLDQFTGVNVNVQHPFWFIIGKTSALLFMFLSGISASLSEKPTKNGFKTLLYGMGISIVTYIFLREEYVRFGILHFLGISMIIHPLFRRLSNSALLALSFISVALGFKLKTIMAKGGLLLPIGITYENFSTIDYYPIFPYIGVTMLGVLFYRKFYLQGKRILGRHNVRPSENPRLSVRLIENISKNSLKIYLIHQPILLIIIFALKLLVA